MGSGTASKAQQSRFWVKRPGASSLVELVSSLAQVCDEHGLDEALMLEVAAGHAADHQGWQCGTAAEYRTGSCAVPTKTPEERTAAAADEGDAVSEDAARSSGLQTDTGETDNGDSAASEAQALAPPQINKIVIQIGVSALCTQLLSRLEKQRTDVVPLLRMVYYGIVAFRLLLHALISWRISVRADPTKVEKPPASDPLSALLGGLRGPQKQQAPTAAEYDRSELHSLARSYQVGAIFVFVMHLALKWNRTLIYSGISSIVDLFFHPLFQIHLLQRPAVGPLKRPFGSDAPDMAALFKKAMPATGALAATAG